jgi:CheY-like chemotaxis protein
MACVLVIDDRDELRLVYSLLLEMEGHEVVCASDGAEGLEVAHAKCPDVVLLDLRMPVLDGLTFLDRLSQQHRPLPAVIAVSAARELRAPALKRGAFAFLDKPTQSVALLNAVEDALVSTRAMGRLRAGRVE